MVYSVINILKGTVEKKADMGCIMSLVKDDNWNQVALKIKGENALIKNKKPNYVFDIYKMRRGQYKNIRIWSYINLGSGEREDLYITTASNEPIAIAGKFYSIEEKPVLDNWEKHDTNKIVSFKKEWGI